MYGIMNHNENDENINHYVVMFAIMMASSLFATMNMWFDKIEDMRLSVNDLYMSLLMNGWMFTFMGLYDANMTVLLFGMILVIVSIWCIRTQFMVTQDQYIAGMIPHHSMAVHMSKKLMEKENNITPFLEKIITSQNSEIIFMKTIE